MGKRPTKQVAERNSNEQNNSENGDAGKREIQTEVARRLRPILQNGANEKQVIERVSMMVQEYSGPIPSADQLAQYEAIQPGFADRIISMAEKQMNHNTSINEEAMRLTFSDGRLGMWLGFIALMTLIAGAIVSIMLNSPTGAALFLGAGALGLVGKFVQRFNNPSK